MERIVEIVAGNAGSALVVALIAILVGRLVRRPALTHLLWVLVLLRLLAPPVLELAHLKRRDHWVRIVELISSTLFWWYPVMWWARYRLRIAEELCCDALVATHLPDHRRAYAQCLMKTVRYLRTDRAVLPAGSAMANFNDLKGRIVMIMKPPITGPSSLTTKLAVSALAVTFLVLSPTLSARSGDVPGFSGDPITLSLHDADLENVLASFARITGITFALDVEQLPWDQALDMMLRVNGLEATTAADGVIQVRRVAPASGTVLSPHPSPRGFGPEDSVGELTPELHRGGSKVFRYVVDGPISAPVKVESPAPSYPEEARKAGTQGAVILETIIDADGTVSDVHVVRGLPNGLTQAAIEAVKRWRFEPARLDGEPVAVILVLTVRFHLDSSEEPV